MFLCPASAMVSKGSTFSFLSVEIMVLRTELLVCLPVMPAALLMDFINEPREFSLLNKMGNLEETFQVVVWRDIL